MSSSFLLLLSHTDLRRWPVLLVRSRHSVLLRRFCSGVRISRSLQEKYRLLQLPEEERSSPEQVRSAYLRLAKLYHPDSGAATADPVLFARVEEAYRAVLTHQCRTRLSDGAEEEEEEQRSRWVALQHRHYLSYDGVGSGPPGQRERQYQQARVDRAAEQVLDYRRREQERAAAGAALLQRDVRQRSRRITQAVERLVEDLIQESMARGDFQNLSGTGKPLNKFQHNPYADPMTHNLNRILVDNGYQPPWVATLRDIREAAGRVRDRLLEGRARLGDPMSPAERDQWERLCGSVQEELLRLNKKVDLFNLTVPSLSMQMVHFSLTREADRATRRAEQRRADLQTERERERQRRKEEKKRSNAAAKANNANKAKEPGLLSWVQNFLRF
ncbi:dnaJ homolog subfamily C member 28 [Austrofundulus limnaeus]|uniref:DnaJ homolog subfamily C member 28 n=1 Tax=Austrofundulus limnaeus TaxID=52670 RepID=A0A2I4AJL4_AUSLI|nr:PREDICTED: dnaJ homolog subfamily C member 28 [Austrofundulus limnaeus]